MIIRHQKWHLENIGHYPSRAHDNAQTGGLFFALQSISIHNFSLQTILETYSVPVVGVIDEACRTGCVLGLWDPTLPIIQLKLLA